MKFEIYVGVGNIVIHSTALCVGRKKIVGKGNKSNGWFVSHTSKRAVAPTDRAGGTSALLLVLNEWIVWPEGQI